MKIKLLNHAPMYTSCFVSVSEETDVRECRDI
jgi:hypothetical protein